MEIWTCSMRFTLNYLTIDTRSESKFWFKFSLSDINAWVFVMCQNCQNSSNSYQRINYWMFCLSPASISNINKVNKQNVSFNFVTNAKKQSRQHFKRLVFNKSESSTKTRWLKWIEVMFFLRMNRIFEIFIYLWTKRFIFTDLNDVKLMGTLISDTYERSSGWKTMNLRTINSKNH